TANTDLKEDLYYNIKPMPFQIKGRGNMFNVQLPVAGIVDSNLSDRIINWQNMYNIVMNQFYSILEKEIGLILLFDINFIPSDIRGNGDTESALYNMLNSMKATGLFAVDAGRENMPQGSNFNQFGVQDLSAHNQLAAKWAQAEMIKQRAWEQFGLNPTALGQPVKYQTATGVKHGVESTMSQTDYLYEAFSNFKGRALEIHLSVAQYAQGNGEDITVQYRKSDSTQAWLKLQDPDLPIKHLGVRAISNSKKRKELEAFKEYLLNTNTLGADLKAIADVITSDSIVTLREIVAL